MIEEDEGQLSIARQCELLSLPRSTYYYKSIEETAHNLKLMAIIDEIYMKWPFYGSRKVKVELLKLGYKINRKKVQRLMQIMCLIVIYPKPNLSKSNKDHVKYPYLLKDLVIDKVNMVWSTDITYIPMKDGFLYLTAVIDWHSRYVIAWKLSKNLESQFCIEVLQEALKRGKPEIFNTDQGSQYTSEKFLNVLKNNDIRISMDGKGRCLDNIFVERLWRSVKYEEVYLKSYENFKHAYENLEEYFVFYNDQRVHQSLGYRVPKSVHFGSGNTIELLEMNYALAG